MCVCEKRGEGRGREGGQGERQTDRQTDRQTYRQTETVSNERKLLFVDLRQRDNTLERHMCQSADTTVSVNPHPYLPVGIPIAQTAPCVCLAAIYGT